MRQIANLFISGLVIWGASKIFPNDVIVKDLGTLVLVTILLWLTTLLINIVASFMMTGGFLLSGFDFGFLIMGVIIMSFSKVFALYILDISIANFAIKGFWLKLLIALLCSIFTIGKGHKYADPD